MARPNREAQILDAALSVFVELGYDRTRTRQIAERAGMSDGGLYSHFRSKEDLALALFRVHIGRYAELLAGLAGDRDQPVSGRVKAIARATLEAFAEEPEAVVFLITHQARFIHALPAEFPYPIRIVEGLLAEGQRDGSVRAGPVRLLAAVVFGCITQPIRTFMEAPAGTIALDTPEARDLVSESAWDAVSARNP